MSIVGLNQLARDLEHIPGLCERFASDPAEVFANYPLADQERTAVGRKDAAWLLQAGMNPVALRNLMVTLGVAHHEMYSEGG